ncbi:MAG: PqqD family protein [Chthonomonadales bacterium]|nr:PqqD family protein [Chthonomonadales bacterium]
MRVPLSLRLKYAAGRYLPFLKIAPPVDRQEVMRLRPVRNPAIEWDAGESGEALLSIPRRSDRVGRAMGFLVRLPEARGVQLDEVGTFVWRLCDGGHTVEGIVKATSQHYKLNRREVEVSVTTYLQMLTQRNFVGWYTRGGKGK